MCKFIEHLSQEILWGSILLEALRGRPWGEDLHAKWFIRKTVLGSTSKEVETWDRERRSQKTKCFNEQVRLYTLRTSDRQYKAGYLLPIVALSESPGWIVRTESELNPQSFWLSGLPGDTDAAGPWTRLGRFSPHLSPWSKAIHHPLAFHHWLRAAPRGSDFPKYVVCLFVDGQKVLRQSIEHLCVGHQACTGTVSTEGCAQDIDSVWDFILAREDIFFF